MSCFLRYQSPAPNGRGHHLGVFALVNGLARRGVLTPQQESYRLAAHAWFNAAYPTPPAELFDRDVNPKAVCWFKASATDLVSRMPEYISMLLDPHGVKWELATTDVPGRVLYEDAWQVVAG